MTKNDALIQVVLERFVNRRLPRILDIKKKVKKGELLNEMDISFFNKVMKDNRDNQHLIKDNEDLKNMLAKAIHLYKEITEMALENEKKSKH
jgi:cell shape-determining protein MreC